MLEQIDAFLVENNTELLTVFCIGFLVWVFSLVDYDDEDFFGT